METITYTFVHSNAPIKVKIQAMNEIEAKEELRKLVIHSYAFFKLAYIESNEK